MASLWNRRRRKRAIEETGIADQPEVPTPRASRRDRASPQSTPRWVYVFEGLGVAIISLVVILHLTGNSPGRMHSGMH